MTENDCGAKGGLRVDRTPANPKEWRDLYEIVLTYALRLTKSRAAAENLTQEAFVRLKTTRPWDRATEPSIAKHMMKTVKSLFFHERKSASARSDREVEAVVEQQTIGGAAAPSPEQMLLEEEGSELRRGSAAEQLETLRGLLVGHELELAILDLVDEDIDDRDEQARLTGHKIEEVYEAWRRIRRYAKQLPTYDDDEEVA